MPAPVPAPANEAPAEDVKTAPPSSSHTVAGESRPAAAHGTTGDEGGRERGRDIVAGTANDALAVLARAAAATAAAAMKPFVGPENRRSRVRDDSDRLALRRRGAGVRSGGSEADPATMTYGEEGKMGE